MNAKITSSILVLAIIATAFYLIFHKPNIDKDYYKTTDFEGTNLLVSKFDFESPWEISRHLDSRPTGIPRWKQLILLSQSDYIKFTSNSECRSFYGRSNVRPDQIDEQRAYTVSRFESSGERVNVLRFYLALDSRAKALHMIIPITGPQGDSHFTLEWIRGQWYLIPGTSPPSWINSSAPEIIEKMESLGLKPAPVDEFERIANHLGNTYL